MVWLSVSLDKGYWKWPPKNSRPQNRGCLAHEILAAPRTFPEWGDPMFFYPLHTLDYDLTFHFHSMAESQKVWKQLHYTISKIPFIRNTLCYLWLLFIKALNTLYCSPYASSEWSYQKSKYHTIESAPDYIPNTLVFRVLALPFTSHVTSESSPVSELPPCSLNRKYTSQTTVAIKGDNINKRYCGSTKWWRFSIFLFSQNQILQK